MAPSVSNDHDYFAISTICDPNNNEIISTLEKKLSNDYQEDKSNEARISNPVSPLSPDCDIGYESMSSPETNTLSISEFILKGDLMTSPYGSPMSSTLPVDILDEEEDFKLEPTLNSINLSMDPYFHDLFPEIF